MLKYILFTLLALYLLVVLIWIGITWKLISGYNQLYYRNKPVKRVLVCVANAFFWPYLIVRMVKDEL